MVKFVRPEVDWSNVTLRRLAKQTTEDPMHNSSVDVLCTPSEMELTNVAKVSENIDRIADYQVRSNNSTIPRRIDSNSHILLTSLGILFVKGPNLGDTLLSAVFFLFQHLKTDQVDIHLESEDL